MRHNPEVFPPHFKTSPLLAYQQSKTDPETSIDNMVGAPQPDPGMCVRLQALIKKYKDEIGMYERMNKKFYNENQLLKKQLEQRNN